jgi:hypothetical protein
MIYTQHIYIYIYIYSGVARSFFQWGQISNFLNGKNLNFLIDISKYIYIYMYICIYILFFLFEWGQLTPLTML